MSRLNATEEELTYYVVDDRRAIRSPWGKGNSKIGPGIYTYSRLPVITCPGATDLCERVCYSKRFISNPLLWDWLSENTHREGLPPLPSDARTVRIHVSGDFDSKEYIEAWEHLVAYNFGVLFFGYTRSWRVPELLPALELLNNYTNMQLFASMDESTPELVPDGWRIAYLCDPSQISKFILTLEHAKVCPEEVGIKANCEECGYCFRGKRGDVLFPIHGEPTA